MRGSHEINAGSVFLNLMKMSFKQFYPFLNLIEYRGVIVKSSLLITRRRNADLNLRLVAATTNRTHFSNNRFINAILGGTSVRLPALTVNLY